MSITGSRIFLVCLLVHYCVQPALPFQKSGAILGRVLDAESNSPIAHATVTARNQDNGSENSAITAVDGTFFVSSLAPGMYTITAESNGFQAKSISGYPVRLSQTAAASSAQIALSKTAAGRVQRNNPAPAEPAILQSNPVESASILEARVRWDAGGSITASNTRAQSAGPDVFSLIEARETSGPLPRQRMPELSKDQILIVILDRQEEQKGWLLIPDPRVVRAESPGPNGELSGEVLYRSSADFLVPVPSDLLPATLRIYQPHWTGEVFLLNLLGTLALR